MPVALFYDEHELLSQLKAGNKAAFTHLFKLYGGPLYLNLLKLLKTEQAAEEILQSIFLINAVEDIEAVKDIHFLMKKGKSDKARLIHSQTCLQFGVEAFNNNNNKL